MTISQTLRCIPFTDFVASKIQQSRRQGVNGVIKSCHLLAGVVSEQASEVPQEREKLSHESRHLGQPGDGGRVTVASDQDVAFATSRGQCDGNVGTAAECNRGSASPDGAILLRRLLESGDDDATLRGAKRIERLPQLRQRQRPGERRLTVAVSSSPSPGRPCPRIVA